MCVCVWSLMTTQLSCTCFMYTTHIIAINPIRNRSTDRQTSTVPTPHTTHYYQQMLCWAICEETQLGGKQGIAELTWSSQWTSQQQHQTRQIPALQSYVQSHAPTRTPHVLYFSRVTTLRTNQIHQLFHWDHQPSVNTLQQLVVSCSFITKTGFPLFWNKKNLGVFQSSFRIFQVLSVTVCRWNR